MAYTACRPVYYDTLAIVGTRRVGWTSVMNYRCTTVIIYVYNIRLGELARRF